MTGLWTVKKGRGNTSFQFTAKSISNGEHTNRNYNEQKSKEPKIALSYFQIWCNQTSELYKKKVRKLHSSGQGE